MGVLAEIAKRVLRAAERAFRVNHPWGAEQWTKPRRERLRILKCGKCSVETKPALGMQFPQAIHKLAPKYFPENTNRQEETPLRVDPPGLARSQTFRREHASTCPPSAAVRQRRIAFSTFRWSQVNHLWLRSKNLSPAARITSATSIGGRGIYFIPSPVSRFLARGRESSGLAVAFKCCCE